MIVKLPKSFTTHLPSVLAFSMSIAIFSGGGSLSREADLFDDATSRKVFRLSESGKCADAWKVIWPYVLRGSNRATVELVGEMTFGNIYPPIVYDPNSKNVKRNQYLRFIADVVFHIHPEMTSSRKDSIQFKRSFLSAVWDKNIFHTYENSQCLNVNAKSMCFDPDSWSGIVKKLSEWNRQFALNEKLGLTARCRRKN
jgi:hypothetical protein